MTNTLSYKEGFYYFNQLKYNELESVITELYQARLNDEGIVYESNARTLEFFNENDTVYFSLDSSEKQKFFGSNDLPDCLQFALLLELSLAVLWSSINEQ